MTVHGPYGLYVETADTSASPVMIGGIRRQRLYTDTQASQDVTAGAVYPFNANVVAQMAKYDFTTLDIETLLDACLPPSVALAGVGATIVQVKKTDGTITAGSVHRKGVFTVGAMILQRLTVESDGNAEIQGQILGRWNGTNDIIVISESIALPGTLTDPDRFAMGALTLGGLAGGLTGKTSIEVDFGVRAEQIMTDGHIWPKAIDVDSYVPKITIKSILTEFVADAKLIIEGNKTTHLQTELQLRKRDGGGFAADGSAVHILMTADGLAYPENVFDSDGNRRGECDVVILCRYDGTTVPIDFSTASALT